MRVVDRPWAILLSLLFLSAPVAAQQSHVVDPGELDRAFAERSDDTAAKRQTIRTALEQSGVREMAERLGLDVARAEAAVSTLDGVVLDQLAAQAQWVNDEIAGGQTVRLNLLWVIIGLLILILIIVA